MLDLRKAGGFTDYFVICTGNNPRQINAIADRCARPSKPSSRSGRIGRRHEKSEWILLDYFNFIVHVFSRECRVVLRARAALGERRAARIADEE